MNRFVLIASGFLAIFMARPDVAEVCSFSPGSGKVVYESTDGKDVPKPGYYLGKKHFPNEQRHEYYFQKYPDIVIAKLLIISDAIGREEENFGYDDMHFPLVFHYEVTRTLKGNVGASFETVAKDGWAFSSCTKKFKPGETYLIFLPEPSDDGKYAHGEIVLSGTPSNSIQQAAEMLEWLEWRIGPDGVEGGFPPGFQEKYKPPKNTDDPMKRYRELKEQKKRVHVDETSSP